MLFGSNSYTSVSCELAYKIAGGQDIRRWQSLGVEGMVVLDVDTSIFYLMYQTRTVMLAGTLSNEKDQRQQAIRNQKDG